MSMEQSSLNLQSGRFEPKILYLFTYAGTAIFSLGLSYIAFLWVVKLLWRVDSPNWKDKERKEEKQKRKGKGDE